MNSGNWGAWFRFLCSMTVVFGTIVGLYEMFQENYQMATCVWFASGAVGWLSLLRCNWPTSSRLVALMFAFFAAYHAFGGDWQSAFFMTGAANLVIFWYGAKQALGK